MIINEDLIEVLLNEPESNSLDLKELQYPFVNANDSYKSELLKDILAFANANKKTDAFILRGVKEVKGGRSIPMGINEDLDDASLQEFVNRKTNRQVDFSYAPKFFEGNKLGVFHIPIQDRPTFLKKDFGKLKGLVCYVRVGTSTSEMSLTQMIEFMQRKDELTFTGLAWKLLGYLIGEANERIDSMPVPNDIAAALNMNLSECKEPIQELEFLDLVSTSGDMGSPIGYARVRLIASTFVKYVSRFIHDVDIDIEIKRTLNAFPENGDSILSELVLQTANVPLVRLQLIINYLTENKLIEAKPCWMGDDKLGFMHGRLLPSGKRVLRGLDRLPHLDVTIR